MQVNLRGVALVLSWLGVNQEKVRADGEVDDLARALGHATFALEPLNNFDGGLEVES